jgi:PAS domain S-box-containing protein
MEELEQRLAEWRRRAEACAAREGGAVPSHEEAVFRTVFDLAGVGIGQLHVPSGRIERCNRKLQAILGYGEAELQQRLFTELVPAEEQEAQWREFRRLVAGEVPEIHLESRFIRKDGSIGWSLVNATLSEDPEDKSLHIIGTVQEISDRVMAEAALRRSETILRLLTENIDDVFWITAPDQCKVLYISPSFERLWGRSRDEIYRDPRAFLDAVHPDDRPRLEAADLRHTGGSADVEYRIIDAHGEVRWVRDRAFPVSDPSGRSEYVAGIATDITGHKRAELRAVEAARKLATANQELERFALTVSHDLKAPLRAVSGLASMLEEEFAPELPAEAVARLRSITARVAQMDRLIDELLQYARAGHNLGAKARVKVGELVAAQVAALNAPAQFRIHVADDLPELETYAAPLAQVFANLIGNAFRHHGRLDGQCWVTARDLGEQVEFTVSDDGPGIPATERERVFDMFYSLKPKSESTGVGLALVKRIVESAGGQVRLEEALAGGSAFTFTWPKRPAEG